MKEIEQLLDDLTEETNYGVLKASILTFKKAIRLLADEIDELQKGKVAERPAAPPTEPRSTPRRR